MEPAATLLGGLAAGYVAFLNWFSGLRETSLLKKYLPAISPYLFVITFAYTTLAGLGLLQIELLQPFDIWIALISFILGFFILFVNREKLSRLEQVWFREKEEENRRLNDFNQKFSKINRLPILRDIVRWSYVEGWFYSLGLGILIITSTFVLSYKVGSHDLREDEFQMVDVATGYYYTGTFYRWDWLEQKSGQFTSCATTDYMYCHYTRAWPHTLLVSASYYLFGISEWSSRIVSVIFGILFIPLVYFVTRFFSNSKKAALLTAAVTLLNPAFIDLFRYTRMYAILIPIFLLLTYVMYRALTETGKTSRLIPLVNKYLNFNYLALSLGVGLLVLNYFIHINSLILLPALFAFIIYLAYSERENKYYIAASVGILGCLLFALLSQLGYFSGITELLSFFEKRNYIYYNLLFSYPFPILSGGILSGLSIAFLIFLEGSSKKKWVYLCFLIAVPLVFFIWIGNRYAGFTYISHIASISIILAISVMILLTKLIQNRVAIFLYTLIIVSVGINFIGSIPPIYGNENVFGKYSTAYAVINQNFDIQRSGLLGQYLHAIYLPSLFGKTINIIDMLNAQQYDYNQFLKDIADYQSGWIAWETRKSYHIQQPIITYIQTHFKKYHGTGVDDTNIEVYFYDKSMLSN
jgi:hypothetical protein